METLETDLDLSRIIQKHQRLVLIPLGHHAAAKDEAELLPTIRKLRRQVIDEGLGSSKGGVYVGDSARFHAGELEYTTANGPVQCTKIIKLSFNLFFPTSSSGRMAGWTAFARTGTYVPQTCFGICHLVQHLWRIRQEVLVQDDGDFGAVPDRLVVNVPPGEDVYLCDVLVGDAFFDEGTADEACRAGYDDLHGEQQLMTGNAEVELDLRLFPHRAQVGPFATGVREFGEGTCMYPVSDLDAWVVAVVRKIAGIEGLPRLRRAMPLFTVSGRFWSGLVAIGC